MVTDGVRGRFVGMLDAAAPRTHELVSIAQSSINERMDRAGGRPEVAGDRGLQDTIPGKRDL